MGKLTTGWVQLGCGKMLQARFRLPWGLRAHMGHSS